MKGWVDLPSLASASKKEADVGAREFAKRFQVVTRTIRKPHGWEPIESQPESQPLAPASVQQAPDAWFPDRKAQALRKHSKWLRKVGHARPTRYELLLSEFERLNL